MEKQLSEAEVRENKLKAELYDLVLRTASDTRQGSWAKYVLFFALRLHNCFHRCNYSVELPQGGRARREVQACAIVFENMVDQEYHCWRWHLR